MPNSLSFFKRFSLGVLSLIVETVCLYFMLVLIFSGAAVVNSISLTLSPFFLLLMGGISLITNSILLLYRLRLFTHLLVNVVLGGSIVWLVLKQLFTDLLLFPVWSTLNLNTGLFLLLQWVSIVASLWLWARGSYWARKNPDYPWRISRFELSMALMIGTLLIAALTGVTIPEGGLWALLGLIANLSILSLVQPGITKSPKNLLGPALVSLILLPVYLIASLLLPGLSGSAAIIIQTIQPLLKLLRDMFLFILLKLLQFNPMVPKSSASEEVNSASAAAIASSSLPSWITSILQYLLWGLLGIIVILVIGGLGYLFYQLFLRLLKKQGPTSMPSLLPSWGELHAFVQRFIFWIRTLVPWAAFLRPQRLDVLRAYQAMMQWGARRRVPKYRFETPHEYFLRLSKHFPTHAADIQALTDWYVLDVYGPKSSNPPSFQELSLAVRKLYRLSAKTSDSQR